MRATAGQLRAAPWTERHERGSLALLRLMARFSLRVGRGPARPILYGIAAYYFLFAPRAVRASRAYLARALGRAPRPAERFAHVLAFATTIHDRVFLLNDRFDLFQIEVRGEGLLAEPLAAGGVLLFGAHLGSFEVARALGRRAALPVVMAAHTDNARKINAALAAVSAAASEVVPLGDNPLALLEVQRLLEQGVAVGILADRTPRQQSTESVSFLGAPARFPTGPFRAAAVLARPVVFMAGLYLGGNRYRVVFEPLADFRAIPRAGREAAVREAIERYAAALERLCREHPYNWFNFYDFWTGA
ncbi:MAG: LpxL/LpxP family acyltransferase [Steroidobacteraceae bacterium]